MNGGEGRLVAETAVRHALGWLFFGNLVGLWMASLLIWPGLSVGEWTYGRWVPVHLNVQLYGWTSLPLVAWLLVSFGAGSERFRPCSHATVWAWTAALAAGVFHWLGGITSGKIFLDWKGGALAAFLAAQCFLWLVLAMAWRRRARDWTKVRRRLMLGGLMALSTVPVALWFASSPSVYPPVDRTTGGPTGSSLLGSTLFVVGLMLLLPRALGVSGVRRGRWWVWGFFGFGWIVFGVTEWIGGTHFDWWQIGAMLCLLPWAWLLPQDWAGREWPEGGSAWRRAMFGWWVLLVVSGLLMYAPGVLDHLKFTQGLVAHSHLAMAGFTTAFCAHLCGHLTGKWPGRARSVALWNVAAFIMVVALATGGWLEGGGFGWMLETPFWRTAVLVVRLVCGVVLAGVAGLWWVESLRKS